MVSKSRFARALAPRFGILWMAAAMLLVVSAAGWWKFHRDLYVDEQAVVEQLKRSGAKIAVHRSDLQYFSASSEEADTSAPWNAPLLDPIQMLFVEGDPGAEARDAALKLPRLKAYGEQLPSQTAPATTGSDDWAGIEAHLGRPLPPLPAAKLDFDSLDDPWPEGTPVDQVEAGRIAAAIHAAWTAADSAPPRRLVVSESEIEGGVGPKWTSRNVELVEPNRGIRHSSSDGPLTGESASLLLDGTLHWFHRTNSRWRCSSRRMGVDPASDRVWARRFPTDDFPYLAPDFRGDTVVDSAMRAAETPYRFDRIAKVDDVRYRVDFSPFEADVGEGHEMMNPFPPKITEWSCILRADFDWAPERSKLVQTKIQDPARPFLYERQLAQRLRREGDYVCLEERIARDISFEAGADPEFNRTRSATELDPKIDERAFDPLALDPEPWPERPELLWLPWYRVTFLLGCGLALFLVGRRFVGSRRDSEPTDPLPISRFEAWNESLDPEPTPSPNER